MIRDVSITFHGIKAIEVRKVYYAENSWQQICLTNDEDETFTMSVFGPGGIEDVAPLVKVTEEPRECDRESDSDEKSA